jgi:hypothetical protein
MHAPVPAGKSSLKRAAPVAPAGGSKKSAPKLQTSSKPAAKGKRAAAPVSSDDEEEEEEEEEEGDDEDLDDLSEEQLKAMLAAMEGDEGDEGDFAGEDGDDEGAFEGDDEDDSDDENLDLDELIDLSSDATAKHRAAERAREAEAAKAAAKAAKKAGKPVPKPAKPSADEEDVGEEGMDASFGFFDPNPEDFHAFKSFVRHVTDDADFDVSGFSDIIAQQAAVGTTVKNDDAAGGPLGFITVLSLAEHADAQSIKQLKSFVLDNAGSDEARARLGKLLSSSKTGLLVQDRVMNLPLEVVPVFYSEILKDLEYVRSETDGAQGDFDNVVVICKCCEISSAQGGAAVGSAKAAKKAKKAEKAAASAGLVEGPVDTSGLWFLKFEDELLAQQAVLSKRFPGKVMVPWPGVGKLPSSHLVLVVPRRGLETVAAKLQDMFTVNGEAASW